MRPGGIGIGAFGRLDDVLTEYKSKPGALIPVLQIAQGHLRVSA